MHKEGCNYFHTVDLTQYLEQLDVKMDDAEPATEVKQQEEDSDKETGTIAANLKSRSDKGGGVTEGDGELREFESKRKRENDRSDTESEGRTGMEQEVAEMAQQGAILQETAQHVSTQNGE